MNFKEEKENNQKLILNQIKVKVKKEKNQQNYQRKNHLRWFQHLQLIKYLNFIKLGIQIDTV